MQRYDCHKPVFPHKMYFGEYYSIVRKYSIVVYKIYGVGERSFHPNFTFPCAIVLSSSSGEKASLMVKNL